MARALLVPTLLLALVASAPAGGRRMGSLRGWKPGSSSAR